MRKSLLKRFTFLRGPWVAHTHAARRS
jgi:hypothetical protein